MFARRRRLPTLFSPPRLRDTEKTFFSKHTLYEALETMTGRNKSRLLTVWHFCLLTAALALIVRYDLREKKTAVNRGPTLEELQSVFSGGVSAALIPSPIPHYQGAVESDRTSTPAAAVATAQLPPKIKGYVDEINTLVVIDRTGTVRGLKVIAHRETPEYMRRVLASGFLSKFIGKNVKEGFKQIDAVTGATITTKAIADDVTAAADLAANRLYGLPVAPPPKPAGSEAWKNPRVLAVLFTLLVALFARFSPWPRRGRRETAWVVSLLFLGVYAMTPYTLAHTCQLLKLDVPGPANALLALLAGFVIITTILFGPLHCAYVCPFGALQELLARLPVRRFQVSPRLQNRARELRWLTLFLGIAGVFGLGVSAFAEMEPFGHLFSRSHHPAAWVFIMAVLIVAVWVRRFWCRFFCPTGACLVLLCSHRRLFRSIGRGLDESNIDRPD